MVCFLFMEVKFRMKKSRMKDGDNFRYVWVDISLVCMNARYNGQSSNFKMASYQNGIG